jgi:GPN-loop GTPase
MDRLFEVMKVKKDEYEREYKPELERRIRERTEERKTEGLEKLMRDMKVGSSSAPKHGMALEIYLMRTGKS